MQWSGLAQFNPEVNLVVMKGDRFMSVNRVGFSGYLGGNQVPKNSQRRSGGLSLIEDYR